MILINRTCPYCQKAQTLRVSASGYNQWKSGKLIQRALPELSNDEREILLTGICPECWDKMLTPMEEEEV